MRVSVGIGFVAGVAVGVAGFAAWRAATSDADSAVPSERRADRRGGVRGSRAQSTSGSNGAGTSRDPRRTADAARDPETDPTRVARRREASSAPPPPPSGNSPETPAADAPATPRLRDLEAILRACRGRDVDPNEIYAAFRQWSLDDRAALAFDIARGDLANDPARGPLLDGLIASIRADDVELGVHETTFRILAERLSLEFHAVERERAVLTATLAGPAGLGLVTRLATADSSADVRMCAIESLDHWRDALPDAAVRAIVAAVSDPSRQVRASALHRLHLARTAGAETVLRLVRHGAIPVDELDVLAHAIVAGDVVPEALAVRDDADLAACVAVALAEAIADGLESRRWYPDALRTPLPTEAMHRLVDSAVDAGGDGAAVQIGCDRRLSPSVRLRAFDAALFDVDLAPRMREAAMRVIADRNEVERVRVGLASLLMGSVWNTAPDDSVDAAVRAAAAALRAVAERETNVWVRDAIVAAIDDSFEEK